MLARGSGAAAAHAVMAAHHEILSNLEAVQRAAIERELVVFRIQIAIGFVAMRMDRPERLGAGAGLCWSANGLVVVDRHRDDGWRRRRRRRRRRINGRPAVDDDRLGNGCDRQLLVQP